MTRILVVGGKGFYGAKVVALLASTHEVVVCSRTPASADELELDLRRPETFGVLAHADLIVNCSDSVHAAPDAAILHVLAHGGTWMEMGADAVTIERLLALEPGATGHAAKGTVILGVGVFPGISTVLATAVAELAPTCQTLELGIRLSPLSGAGRGNCALMAESLFTPAYRWEQGQRRQSRTALGPSVLLPYDGVPARSINFALPDTVLIQRATNAPTVIAHLALVPGWLRFNFGALAWCVALLRFMKRPLVWMLELQLALLRAWLLRGVESRVQMVALADRNTDAARSCSLSFEDGQRATAQGVAAAVDAWVHESEHRVGLFGVANYFTLAQIVTGLERCGAAPQLTWSGPTDSGT